MIWTRWYHSVPTHCALAISLPFRQNLFQLREFSPKSLRFFLYFFTLKRASFFPFSFFLFFFFSFLLLFSSFFFFTLPSIFHFPSFLPWKEKEIFFSRKLLRSNNALFLFCRWRFICQCHCHRQGWGHLTIVSYSLSLRWSLSLSVRVQSSLFFTFHWGPEQPKIQTEVLGHSLVCSLVPSHRSLVCLLRSTRFARALHCVHSLARSLTLLTPELVRKCMIGWLFYLCFFLFWPSVP